VSLCGLRRLSRGFNGIRAINYNIRHINSLLLIISGQHPEKHFDGIFFISLFWHFIAWIMGGSKVGLVFWVLRRIPSVMAVVAIAISGPSHKVVVLPKNTLHTSRRPQLVEGPPSSSASISLFICRIPRIRGGL